MRTLHHIPKPEKRRRIARETMDIYAPLAERVGMYEFMKEMQTLAFQQLEPEAYESITRRLEQMKAGGDQIARIASHLRLLLGTNGIAADVAGREKHPYSIWRKMTERHISFEQLSDIMAFRVIVKDTESCYKALGLIHQRWPMVPGRFKDYISTPKRNGYQSLHTSIIHNEKARVEIQIRSEEMHAQAEYGFASHWAYKQGRDPDGEDAGQARWISDLVEILDQADSPEELLEHTRMAMYQDKIFAFTPKGEIVQLPKGATPIDFAYAVHSRLGDQTVGAKINGRVVPLRTPIENGDQVVILKSAAQQPQPGWLNFVVTAKAQSALRRFVRHKEREETIALGRKFFDEIVARLPAPLNPEAMAAALKRLHLADEPALMIAIARRTVSDADVLEALMPGAGGNAAELARPQPGARGGISIRGLTPGVAFHLAPCCHPVPGDRIVGLRRPGEGVDVHTIDCPTLAQAPDLDWVDLSWGDESDGATAQLKVIVKNEPGSLGVMASLFGQHGANILNLGLVHRDAQFHTFRVDLEVRDRQQLERVLAALRAADAISSAERTLSEDLLVAAA